jgi:hypothetical protein
MEGEFAILATLLKKCLSEQQERNISNKETTYFSSKEIIIVPM